MSTAAASKLRTLNLKTRLTPAQRQWVNQLGVLGGAPVAGIEELEDAVAPSVGDKRDLVGGLSPSDIPFKVSCDCQIHNLTDRTLVMDPASIKFESGKFDSSPPDEIAPNEPDTGFRAVNKPPFLAGAAGQFEYIIDEQSTRWVIAWDNPRFNPFGKNEAPTRVEGPNKGRYTVKSVAGSGDEAKFSYTLKLKGGSAPGPKPPGPVPSPEVKASCLITVTNKTEFVLTLSDQGHDRGDFMTFPGSSLQPGASTSFASVETPNSKEQGCKGFLVWEVGSPMAAVWRIEWDNPEQEKNTTKTSIDPQTAGFRSLDQIGQGEDNVPVAFTISGGGGGQGPGPVPPPGAEPEFKPPVESKQPTLRKGDKSQDRWVEYLQFLLNSHLGTNLAKDGDFGAATHQAVIAFQKKKKLLVDGVVGDQTWAALREGMPEPPRTDGRQPHTFVEKGTEARWSLESENNNRYFKDPDEFQLAVDTVGDTDITAAEATIRITPPNTKPRVVKAPLGPLVGKFHLVKLPTFRKTFPSADPNAKVIDYLVEAYLPEELGGDFYSAKVREA